MDRGPGDAASCGYRSPGCRDVRIAAGRQRGDEQEARTLLVLVASRQPPGLGPHRDGRPAPTSTLSGLEPPGELHSADAAHGWVRGQTCGYTVLDPGPDTRTPPASLTASMAADDDLVGVTVSRQS